MYRLLALVAVLLALVGGSLVAASPQDATPAALPSSVGYPELQVRATQTSFELPSEVAAGRWLVTLENATPQDTAFTLMGPASGETRPTSRVPWRPQWLAPRRGSIERPSSVGPRPRPG